MHRNHIRTYDDPSRSGAIEREVGSWGLGWQQMHGSVVSKLGTTVTSPGY